MIIFKPDILRRCNAAEAGSKPGEMQRTAIGDGQQVLPAFNVKTGGGQQGGERLKMLNDE